VNQASANVVLFRNVRLVLPDRIVEDASLLIENGRIARIQVTSTSAQSGRDVRAPSKQSLCFIKMTYR